MAAERRVTGFLLQSATILLLASCANAFSLGMTLRPDHRSHSLVSSARPTPSRAEFLRGAALAGAAVLLPISPAAVGAEDPPAAVGAEDPSGAAALSFTAEFSCSRGPLGIRLQEMRIPKGKATEFGVIISAVDPRGQVRPLLLAC